MAPLSFGSQRWWFASFMPHGVKNRHSTDRVIIIHLDMPKGLRSGLHEAWSSSSSPNCTGGGISLWSLVCQELVHWYIRRRKDRTWCNKAEITILPELNLGWSQSVTYLHISVNLGRTKPVYQMYLRRNCPKLFKCGALWKIWLVSGSILFYFFKLSFQYILFYFSLFPFCRIVKGGFNMAHVAIWSKAAHAVCGLKQRTANGSNVEPLKFDSIWTPNCYCKLADSSGSNHFLFVY